MIQSKLESIDNDPVKADKYEEYDPWKAHIIEHFNDPTEQARFKTELNDTKQRDKERVKDFRYRLEKVLKKGYGPRFVLKVLNQMSL